MNTHEEPIASGFLDAARKAVEQFPVEAARIEPVMHSENVTFRVTDRDGGAPYVLRLHRPGYNSLAELESERIWVRALKETGVTVPESLETRRGGHFTRVDIPVPGYTKVPRISLIVLEGEISADTKNLAWYYPAAFGDNAVRVRQVDEAGEQWGEEIGVIKNYLRMIEDEAFRCKDITEKIG